MPFVVAGQVATLVLPARMRGGRGLIGCSASSPASSRARPSRGCGRTALGFEGVSRSAFVADAMLLTIAALGWRGVWVLRLRERCGRASRSADGDLVDRHRDKTLRGMVGSLYRYRELLRNLVIKDLKLKYRGSVFGFLWSLANPLLMIVVYTVAFTFILRVRSEGFVFYLMLGLLSWTFFASSASMSTGSIVDNAGLLKSVPLSAGDPADRDGAVQPRAVPADDVGVPADHAVVVPRAAVGADAAVPGVGRAAGRCSPSASR